MNEKHTPTLTAYYARQLPTSVRVAAEHITSRFYLATEADARIRALVVSLEEITALAKRRRLQTGEPSQGHEDYERIADAALKASQVQP